MGDLLDFGQVFKAFGPNFPHSWAIFVKVSKSISFLVKSFLGNSYRYLAIIFLVTLMPRYEAVAAVVELPFLIPRSYV